MKIYVNAQMLQFFTKLRQFFPPLYTNGRIVALVVSIAFTLAFLFLTVLGPDELLYTWVDKAPYWMALLIAGFTLSISYWLFFSGAHALTALIIWNWEKGLTIVPTITTKALGDGALSLGEDHYIYTEYERQPVGELETALERKKKSTARAGGEYIVVIPFRSQNGILFENGYEGLFDRADLPLGPADVEFKNAADFSVETWEDYQIYLAYYAQYHRANITRYKVENAPDDQKTAALWKHLKSAAVSVLLLLSCPVFGQDPAMIPGYMSAVVPKSGADVFYRYEHTTTRRKGDGQLSVVQLLAKGLSQVPDGGICLGVAVDGIQLKPAPQKIETARTALVSRNVAGVYGDSIIKGVGSMPTPDQAVKQIAEWKISTAKEGDEFMFVSFAYWDFFSWWMHRNVFPFLAILICAAGLVAWSSASEYVINTFGRSIVGPAFRAVHGVSGFILYCAQIGMAVVVVIDIMILMITKGFGWIAITIIALILSRIGGWFIGKNTPDATMVHGGYETPQKKLT